MYSKKNLIPTNVFIVGSPKAGTTSLVEVLSGIEDIFIPKIKEPAFFCFEKRVENWAVRPGSRDFPISTLSSYLKLFESASDKDRYSYFVDASVDYFDSAAACKWIKFLCPEDTKIIILRRRKVDLMVSLFCEMQLSGGEFRGSLKDVFLDGDIDLEVANKMAVRSLRDLDYRRRLDLETHIDRFKDSFGENCAVFNLVDGDDDVENILEFILNRQSPSVTLPKVNSSRYFLSPAVLAIFRWIRRFRLFVVIPSAVKGPLREWLEVTFFARARDSDWIGDERSWARKLLK